MELTFSDMKHRKSLNNERKKKHLSQEMQGHCIEQSRSAGSGRSDGPQRAGPQLAAGGVSTVFSNLLQSLLAEELTFEFVPE